MRLILEDGDAVVSRGSSWSRELLPWVVVAWMLGWALARAYYVTPWAN